MSMYSDSAARRAMKIQEIILRAMSGEIMARRRLEEVEAVGAEVLLTECNSCVHNLCNAKLRRQKFQIFNTSQFINLLMEEAA